jgi:HTH-type transcriptional regulator/antitoxin HipB
VKKGGEKKMHEDPMTSGQQRYEDYWAQQMADPEFRAVYEEEAAKKELWLQLVEARQAAGLTQAEVAKRLGVSQAQVARIEKRGYDAYTLNTLRRYVQALGHDFTLQAAVRRVDSGEPSQPLVVHQ